MSICGVIFDLDGTLADTLPVCCAAFRPVLLDITGKAYSDREIMALFGPNEEGILQRLAGEAWPAALERFLAEYESHHDACRAPFPGIDDVLGRIDQRGARLAIVTGKGAGSAAISVRRLGLGRYFDLVVSGSSEGVVKADQIRDIAESWGLPAEQLAYVGDTAYDMDHAHAAGAVAIAAAWAETADRQALAATRPREMFATIAELAGWVERDVCS
ncbi:MAG TPA: HAD hydrolase-like protein [Thermomicrobiales bacterium]|nr:HAD hydrolase-like protein [Thermomicrobiales bacterium]